VRRAAVVLAGVLLLAAPAPASADVIFDAADADELASVLAEAYTDQGVCYGWHVSVDNVGVQQVSVGSNFGAGKSADTGSCKATVEFRASITYTSESSESEDSASYDLHSTPSSLTRDDLDALGLDFDGLTGDDPGAVVGKAVTALPLLAADKGIATPLSAAPDTATAPADAQLTDDPGSDWWRDRGGMLIWALVLMAASGVLIWWILRVNRRRRPAPAAAVPDHVPDYVPDYVSEPWEGMTTAAPREPETGPPSTEDEAKNKAEVETEDETSVTEPRAADAAGADADSAAAGPAGAEPPVADPSGVEPAAAEPSGADSAGAEPAPDEVAAAEPSDAEPSDAESAAAESAAAEPSGAEQAAGEPAADPADGDPAVEKRSGGGRPPQKPTSSDESTKE